MHSRPRPSPSHLAVLAIVAAGSCAHGITEGPLVEQQVGSVVAFVGVSVISMETDRVDPSRTVIVTDGRITAITPATIAPPDGATRIDGGGKFLIPGLIDMHVHMRRADFPAYVAHGVTSVRNMWGYGGLLALKETSDGALIYGPTSPAIYSVSPGLDGPNVQWPETRVVASAADAEAAVEEMKVDGWRWLKAYSSLSRESYDAIVAAARARGLPVLGHVPFSIDIHHALAMKQMSIEHLSGYDRALSGGRGATAAWLAADLSKAPALAAETKSAGTWNCPTSAVLDAIAARGGSDTRRQAAEARRGMVRALHQAGARLIAGTDAGIDITLPGTSIHDELKELVASGLTPYEALRAATKDAAEFLGREGEIGMIAAGKRADFVLLRENPLAEIARSRAIEGVMVRGRWFAR
ncbi:MAG TPA: amidohydrolase family protein [Gemmatimonadaceae bacterium]|nr:amidohydrolase family protein [Gemmatimonadaceae bacterium]